MNIQRRRKGSTGKKNQLTGWYDERLSMQGEHPDNPEGLLPTSGCSLLREKER